MKIKYIGKTCPYCKTPFREGDSVVFCSICDMPHHLSCWTANEGCTTFGCTGSMSEIVEGNKVDQAVDIGVSEGEDNKKIGDGISSGARYEVITELPEGKLQDDTEILIEKVSLIKDNTDGSIFVRCSFRSLTDKPIKALLVDVAATDVWGKSLEGCEGFQILDLKTKKDSVFGQTTPIKMQDSNTRGVDVIIRKILYEDMSMVECQDSFSTIGRQQTLDELLGDREVVAEYVRETYGTSRFVPCKGEKIWRCSCGAINEVNHLSCYKCNAEFDKLLEALKPARLKANSDKYLEEKRIEDEKNREEREKQQREAEDRLKKAQEEKERQERAEKEEKKKKRNRIIKRAVLSIVACIALVALVYVTGWHLIPLIRYNMATSNVEKCEFDSAYNTYIALKDYKDSPDKAIETLYKKASYLEGQEQYKEAAAEYEKIPDYQDSKEKAVYCNHEASYRDARAKFEAKDYDGAITIFTALGDYSDSKEWIPKSKYAKASDLFDSKEYSKAADLFKELGNYEDSKERMDESKYLMAEAAYANKDYKTAYEGYDSLGSGYKDAKEKAKDAKYLYACECLSAKKYKDASDLLNTLKDYKEGQDKFNESTYAYAKECYDSKKYDDARTYFARVKGYEDSDNLWKDASYNAGIAYIKSKDYKKAISLLEDVKGYSDSATKINEAKYAYVKDHKNRTDTTTYSYLKDLKSSGYSDSSKIYNSLYAWNFTIYAVNNSENSSSNMSSISRYDRVYFHYKVSGGPPNGELTIKFSGNMPNCPATTGKATAYNGTDGWYNIYFTYGNTSGTAVGRFYDSSGNLLDSASVSIY